MEKIALWEKPMFLHARISARITAPGTCDPGSFDRSVQWCNPRKLEQVYGLGVVSSIALAVEPFLSNNFEATILRPLQRLCRNLRGSSPQVPSKSNSLLQFQPSACQSSRSSENGLSTATGGWRGSRSSEMNILMAQKEHGNSTTFKLLPFFCNMFKLWSR